MVNGGRENGAALGVARWPGEGFWRDEGLRGCVGFWLPASLISGRVVEGVSEGGGAGTKHGSQSTRSSQGHSSKVRSYGPVPQVLHSQLIGDGSGKEGPPGTCSACMWLHLSDSS